MADYKRKIPKPRERSLKAMVGLLETPKDKNPKSRISLGALLDSTGENAYGVVLLLLTLPNIFILSSLIPGLPFLCGAPAMLVCVQMILGFQEPWLPDWVRGLSVRKTTAIRCLKFCARFAFITKPGRGERILENEWVLRLVGLVAFFLTFLICLPLPIINILPGIALLLIAIGLSECDVVVTLGAVFLGIFSLGLMLFSGDLLNLATSQIDTSQDPDLANELNILGMPHQ
jgi:hypothetical protein